VIGSPGATRHQQEHEREKDQEHRDRSAILVSRYARSEVDCFAIVGHSTRDATGGRGASPGPPRVWTSLAKSSC